MRFAFFRPLFALAGLLMLLLAAGHAPAAEKSPEYSVAVLPFIPPSEVKRRWQPVLDQISHDTGLRLRFRFYEDNESFERGLTQHEVDFAVMTPLQMWLMRQHYRPLLRSSQPLVGLLVVRNDSPARQPTDLQGKRVGLMEGDNQPSSMLVRRALREQKAEVELVFTRSETNALRSVVLGKADAAIANNYILKLLPPEMQRQVRVIYNSSELPPPPFAVGQHIAAEDAARIKSAILHFRESHQALLDAILMSDIMEADLERDYAPVGKMLSGEKP